MTDADVSLRLAGKAEQARGAALRVERERSALKAAESRLEVILAAREVLQDAAVRTQTRVHSRIAAVVSRCLAAVFAEPYEFRVAFEQKRGKTEARLILVRDGIEHEDATDAVGGGVVDVASFALRLTCLMLTQPPPRRLLVLDEPFRHLSAGHAPAARKLLETMAEEFGVQVLMVTHNHRLATGKVVELEG